MLPALLDQPSVDGPGTAWALLSVWAVGSLGFGGFMVVRPVVATAGCFLTLAAVELTASALDVELSFLDLAPTAACLFMAGALASGRVVAVVGGTVLIGTCLGTVVNRLTADAEAQGGLDVLAGLLTLALALVAGLALRAQRETAAATLQTLDGERRLRVIAESEAAARERARIAREMHDVVAHSVTLLVLNAETMRARRGELPDWAGAQADGMADAGRRAGREIRALLELLRTDDPPGPAPGLDDLPMLVEEAGAGGHVGEPQGRRAGGAGAGDDGADGIPRRAGVSLQRAPARARVAGLDPAGVAAGGPHGRGDDVRRGQRIVRRGGRRAGRACANASPRVADCSAPSFPKTPIGSWSRCPREPSVDELRVVVVDDEQAIRDALAMLLGAHRDLAVVGSAADGAAALDLCARQAPDVVLLDLRMPGTDGLTFLGRLGELAHRPRVVVLTTFDLDEHVRAALALGADGFLLKTSPHEEIADAVRRVAAGEMPLSPKVARTVVDGYLSGAAVPSADPDDVAALATLTARESQVLALLGSGRSNAQISAELFLSLHTVKTHVSRILTKTGSASRGEAAALAHRTESLLGATRATGPRP